MNYLQRKKLAFMSIVNQIKGFVRTVVGLPPLVLPDCVDGTNLINYSISGNSVQNGTPSPDNPVEIESVGEKSKNLLKIAGRTEGTTTGKETTTIRNFDFNKYYVGFTRTNEYTSTTYVTYHSVSGNTVAVETNMTYVGVAFPVKVKPNTNYYLSNSNNLFIGTGFYTINGEYIGANHYKNFTTPENCEIITVVCSPTVKDTVVTFENIQLEEGTVATDYEPYGYKIPIQLDKVGDYEPYVEPIETAIYLDEPLRKVGDVADYIDFENGMIVRNIKTLDLDHKSGWISKYTWENKNSINFMLHLDDDYTRAPGLSNRNNIFSFNRTEPLSMWIGLNNTNFFWIGILDYLGFEDDDNSTAVNKFKVWLADNPTYIHYPTSTPIEEPINLPNIPTLKGTTILSPSTTVQPSNMSATYYSTSKE